MHSTQIAMATERHLAELYKLLISRVVERVQTPKITIIPHGTLHLLPFHAFFDGKTHLMDSFEISYAPSASVLKYCLEKKDVAQGVPVLIGVADDQAPFVENEILRIRSLFPNAQTLLNSTATRDAFVEATTQAAFVHIATHAIFRQDNPMFSGFKLADGWMTAFDVFSMNCQTNLVTLSGCKSGMSQVTGSDDLVGLMRGFLYAGARALMVSLWNVDDQATATLMSKFYDFWKKGNTRSSSLTLAMKALRKTHPNPFYWAPFLLIGKA
jgi:CHAT domain-containing protein